jgi:hypothetical protein
MSFYVGEVGKRIEIFVIGVDLTNAVVEYRVQRPNGSIVVWSATVDDVEQGLTSYVLASGDLNTAGDYKISPKITLSSSNSLLFGSVVDLYVNDLYT